MFLVNSPQENFRCDLMLIALGRAYTEGTLAFLPSSFPSFHPLALAHLRQPTCVGLRYGLGRVNPITFSRQLVHSEREENSLRKSNNPSELPNCVSVQNTTEGPEY